MSIVGIVASERQSNLIKKQVEEQNFKIEIIPINYKSVENIKNIKFEILVIQDSLEKLKEKQNLIIEIVNNAKYLLLNTDTKINEEILKDISATILTYGLKQKATITVSGIEENQVIISVQRAFKNLKGKLIEQQEIPVKLIKKGTKDLYNSLIKTAIINICTLENR